ncbi:nucleotidyltransferase domain-containing protein [Acanthopleuribacter pedis]|uniref:Nucleotidyltransferase family protein n=1 Tax=Acanthopleuribacter pedis TaxID=442870 RepID=A0A8J7QC12_9BACT|nr:nucleotidyltransferase family protein [Acanthopleuribacter pedis]MBO1318221.1 nucleotidyltransferase family protein [Acanthopleuribacter pedis]
MVEPWRLWLTAAARQEAEPPEAVGPVDWNLFLAKAEQHQMSAFCYQHRRAQGRPAAMPASVWEALRFEWLHHHMRNLKLFQELQEVHAALDSAGLEHLFAKGPWLAFRAWPASGARPVGDIDLVVHEHDAAAVWLVLRDLGYTAESPCPADGAEALAFAHYRRQYRFFATGRRPLELHFRLVNMGPPSKGEPWLWQGRRLATFEGGVLPVPSPTCMLFHLLLHANQHGYAVLRLFLDIRFHLDHAGAEVDNDLFQRLMRRYHLTCSFHFTLHLTRHLTALTLPETLTLPRPNFLQRWRFALLWSPQRAADLALPRTWERFEAPKLYLAEMATPLGALTYARGVARAAGGWSALLRQVLGSSAGEVRP